jgi:hypothetical protein
MRSWRRARRARQGNRRTALAVTNPSRDWKRAMQPLLEQAEADHYLVLNVSLAEVYLRQDWLGRKSLPIGTDYVVPVAWMNDLESTVAVLTLSGALYDRSGKLIRAASEGILAGEPTFWQGVLAKTITGGRGRITTIGEADNPAGGAANPPPHGSARVTAHSRGKLRWTTSSATCCTRARPRLFHHVEFDQGFAGGAGEMDRGFSDELGKLLGLHGRQVALLVLGVGVKEQDLVIRNDVVIDDPGAPRFPRPVSGRRILRRRLVPGIKSPASGSAISANSSSNTSCSLNKPALDFSKSRKRLNST